MRHRGPDDQGWLVMQGDRLCRGREWTREEPVSGTVLLHQRLSILDLAETGWQPMSTADGRYHIVFNGEIYNYVELRRQLAGLGYRFQSTSDTEVLLAAYAEWGVNALPRLVGMFAFAILDARERSLLLARDFFGIKPLHYSVTSDGVVFSSEIKTILEAPGVPRQANSQRVYDYLRYSITNHGEETLFAGIRQLPAAHFIQIDLRAATPGAPVRFWEIDLQQRVDLSFQEAADAVRDRFIDNVRLHMRSDVPVGAALSGGIDSSAIVMAMRHLEPAHELHTFSYVAEDAALSEERWAGMVADAASTRSHLVRPTPEELVADLDELVRVQDEPFFSTSMYAQYRIFRAASEAGIKVMLDGQGADEILGGYGMYSAARLVSLIRQGRLAEGYRFLRNTSRLPGRGQVWRPAGQFLIPPALQGPFRWMVGESLIPEWLNSRWLARNGVAMQPLRRARGRDVLREQLHDTLVHSSLPALLRFEDRNSMAYSVESRVPFLTPDFVQFVLALPEEYLISPDGTTKSVLRQALRGIVPDAVLDRKDKVGFATPEQRWLGVLRPWVDGVLASKTAARVPALNLSVVRHQWDEVTAGRRRLDSRIWRWVSLIRWAEVYSVDFDVAG
jgi:asparagine synthase (glutamine-hydrolysing)